MSWPTSLRKPKAAPRRRPRAQPHYIASKLGLPILPNSVTRVVADAGGGLAHLNLQYLDWLALQLLPDTAEIEGLDRQRTRCTPVEGDGAPAHTLQMRLHQIASGSCK